MQFIVHTTPEELQRARQWWQDLEGQWKMAYNETAFGKGPTLEPPHDDELMLLLLQVDTLRFAGPLAPHPNMSTTLTNLSGLIPLYHLRFLSLSHHQITDLQPLQRFTNMRHLFLYNNQLKSLRGIEKMSELEDLYVQHNQLTSIEPLRRLTSLKTVYVSSNCLTDLKGITKAHAQHLKKFYVQPNDDLPDREIIRIQNEIGILCRMG